MMGATSLQFATASSSCDLSALPRASDVALPLPNHPDAKPSFSAKPGREPGTTIVACSCGHEDELLDYFRKLGYRLGPMRMAATAESQTRRSLSTTSVAFRALTRSEQGCST